MPEKDEDDESKLPGGSLTSTLQNASEEALEQQARLFNQFLQGRESAKQDSPIDSIGPGGSGGLTDRIAGFGNEVGAFKARVQTGGRISIPDTERDALGIGEEDLVQVFVVPVENNDDNDKE